MKSITISELMQTVVILFNEAYEGQPAGTPTWFVDNGPRSGIFATLREVSAAEAFAPVGSDGATIASHAGHLRWSLALVNRTMRGEPYQANWSESWNPVEAGADEWERLRADLRQEFDTLRDGMNVAFESEGSPVELEGEVLTGLISLIPHAAYHFGVILQMVERVRG
jgi:hypothetical protein